MAMPEPFGMKVDRYLPEEINVWMYAMVAIGSAFVVFVIISVYLMWRSMRAERADIERETLCEAEEKEAHHEQPHLVAAARSHLGRACGGGAGGGGREELEDMLASPSAGSAIWTSSTSLGSTDWRRTPSIAS